ncbi:MAG: GNAT family N-acetyltransferase [Lachnospiraceae bacterium]|nr:GNAT family N-acetyltransferase [Lachnospiraceae bacterium]
MHATSITLQQVPCNHPDFLQLCDELDMFLNRAIGGEDKREKYKKYNYLDTMDYVMIAYDRQHAAGCAALRKYSETEIEVKRVFVRDSYRAQGIGGQMLEHLIQHASEMGYKRMLLETGAFLDASVRLYKRYGFEQIENYGDYKDMPESLCMGRKIKTNHCGSLF